MRTDLYHEIMTARLSRLVRHLFGGWFAGYFEWGMLWYSLRLLLLWPVFPVGMVNYVE